MAHDELGWRRGSPVAGAHRIKLSRELVLRLSCALASTPVGGASSPRASATHTQPHTAQAHTRAAQQQRPPIRKSQSASRLREQDPSVQQRLESISANNNTNNNKNNNNNDNNDSNNESNANNRNSNDIEEELLAGQPKRRRRSRLAANQSLDGTSSLAASKQGATIAESGKEFENLHKLICKQKRRARTLTAKVLIQLPPAFSLHRADQQRQQQEKQRQHQRANDTNNQLIQQQLQAAEDDDDGEQENAKRRALNTRFNSSPANHKTAEGRRHCAGGAPSAEDERRQQQQQRCNLSARRRHSKARRRRGACRCCLTCIEMNHARAEDLVKRGAPVGDFSVLVARRGSSTSPSAGTSGVNNQRNRDNLGKRASELNRNQNNHHHNHHLHQPHYQHHHPHYRNKSTVINANCHHLEAKQANGTSGEPKRSLRGCALGHLQPQALAADHKRARSWRPCNAKAWFLLLKYYLLFTMLSCDKKHRSSSAAATTTTTTSTSLTTWRRCHQARAQHARLWLLLFGALALSALWRCGQQQSAQSFERTGGLLLRASALQVQPQQADGGANAAHQLPSATASPAHQQATRTDELKSAVLATMLVTQSTLAELNSSLPRPHFLPATSSLAADRSTPGLSVESEPDMDSTLAPLELDAASGSARAAASTDDETGGAPELAYDEQPPPLAANASSPAQQQQQQHEAASAEQVDYLEPVLNFCRIFIMGAIIVGDICGNSLVILSVCRHSKLRVTTNWFVVSLACADILVALFAMTFNASVIIWGRWLFNPWVCDFWNSCDVLASTASILHLCCISIDRYIAIMRPLDYPMKITTRRVMYALCAVWISSALLSCIPIFTGIYTTSEHSQWLKENPDQCEFVVNRVYAIVSSSISFWIPCCIMVFTYYRIYREASRQEKFIYKAQSMIPAPMVNHHNNHSKSKQRRSKSMAAAVSTGVAGGAVAAAQANERIKNLAGGGGAVTAKGTTTNSSAGEIATTELGVAGTPTESQPLTASTGAVALGPPISASGATKQLAPAAGGQRGGSAGQQQQQQHDDDDDRDSNSGQSTPTKRSISKMKREHKAAKTLGIIMGVFILCWLPFFSWYTPQHICGKACEGMLPRGAVTLLFWIGYFNSTLNPIIYAYFNHEFRDAFKKTLQWIFCCCQDLKCLRVNRPNDNQHYNCTYRSTQEIGLVTNG